MDTDGFGFRDQNVKLAAFITTEKIQVSSKVLVSSVFWNQSVILADFLQKEAIICARMCVINGA